jgi:2,4-dienoyl-CoA reductase-like NADH-dependent reductase (Old Yellow Enzyme family)
MSQTFDNSLFEPLTLRSLRIPNRVWMSPMCTYSAAESGPQIGSPTDWHLAHLASRAAGGTGLVMVEATAVRPDGRITPWDLGLWNDKQESAFARIAQTLRLLGTIPAIQLSHAGRKASSDRPWLTGRQLQSSEHGWTTVAPSPLPYGDRSKPHELSHQEIAEIVDSYANAARRAARAGFQVAEIHGAHGYLIGSFLSPFTNSRSDIYGGSFENRTRFAREIVKAVRNVWPAELPLFFRLSATDWFEENPDDHRQGWELQDTIRLAGLLRQLGVDLLDTSSGGLVPDAKIISGPGYQVPFAQAVKEKVGMPVAAVGLITDADQAAGIINDEQADAVFLGRELLRNPYWPLHAAEALGHDSDWPIQYGYALKTSGRTFQQSV